VVYRIVALTLAMLAGITLAAGPLGRSSETTARSRYVDTHMHIDGMLRGGGASPTGRGERRRPPRTRRDEMKGRSASYTSATRNDYETAGDNLVSLMDQYGVAFVLIMPPPQNPDQRASYDYRALLPAVKKHPRRLGLVAGGGTLNPLIQGTDFSRVTSDVRKRFKEQAESLVAAGVKGFGELTAFHLCMSETHHYVASAPDHPLFLLLADIAAQHGLPIDMHMEAVTKESPTPPGLLQSCSYNPRTLPATIPAFERLLAHNREAVIVWQHIGWDNTGQMTAKLLRRLLTAHENLYLSLRVEQREQAIGGGPMLNRIVDGSGNIQSEWMKLIVDFSDRVLVGGDEFVGIPGKTPKRPQSFEETWSLLDKLPEPVAAKVGGDNARRIYPLDP